MGVVQR